MRPKDTLVHPLASDQHVGGRQRRKAFATLPYLNPRDQVSVKTQGDVEVQAKYGFFGN